MSEANRVRAVASPKQRAAALKIARWAQERVPLYRELYAGLTPVTAWDDFLRLPVLTAARLRATPLAEQVDALDDVLRSQTAYALRSAVTPRALVLDADDSATDFDQTRAAFGLLGVRKGGRVALVTAPEQRYAAAETADKLGYFGIDAHVLIALDPATTARALAAIAPQYTISFGVSLAGSQTGVVTTRQSGIGAADLYVVPEAGIVGVRREGSASYRMLTRYVLFESDEAGTLLLTALLRYHQPLIRYELRDRGRMVRGGLRLEEVAS